MMTLGNRYLASSRVCLWWTENERAVAKLLVLLDDGHGPVQEVEVDPEEGAELSDA
jgi:hypothetical protein